MRTDQRQEHARYLQEEFGSGSGSSGPERSEKDGPGRSDRTEKVIPVTPKKDIPKETIRSRHPGYHESISARSQRFPPNFSHMKVFLKSFIYTLTIVAFASGIVYAATTVTTVIKSQPIGTDDIIGEGWFQQVNDRVPPPSSNVPGQVLTISTTGEMVWQAPKCGTSTAAP